MKTKTMDDATRIADEMRDAGLAEISRFKNKLEANPAHAFEWSADAFRAAARLQVAGALHAAAFHAGEVTVDSVKSFSLDHVVRAARSPARSTSVQSNLMEQEIASIWAEVYERLNR